MAKSKVKVDEEAIRSWNYHAASITNATTRTAIHETKRDKSKRIDRLKKNYSQFSQYYFPHYAEAGNADFHNEAGETIKNDANIFAVLEWPRGHAKSVHADVIVPLYLKVNNLLSGMVLVGKSESDACSLLGDIQAELQFNEIFKADFGEQMRQGSWTEGQFTTSDGIEFIALGRKQSPRGIRNRDKRPNYLVIDDIDDDELVENEDRVDKVVKWIRGALLGALSLKGARKVMVGNRIHPKSVLANIVGDVDEGTPKNEIIWHSKIYAAYNKHTRLPSDTLPLDPEIDIPAWNYYTIAELNRRFSEMTSRIAWQEYFHRFIPTGKIFKPEWINWRPSRPLVEYEHLVAYFDPSWKAGSNNDFKAIVIMGKHKQYYDIIKAFTRQCSIGVAVKWIYDQYEIFKPLDGTQEVECQIWMEAIFMQEMLLDEFTAEGLQPTRNYQVNIRGDYRSKPEKKSRIENISPLWERGFVWYNEAEKGSRDMKELIDQTIGFSFTNGIHDDGPDACEGAIFLLNSFSRSSTNHRRMGVRQSRGY